MTDKMNAFGFDAMCEVVIRVGLILTERCESPLIMSQGYQTSVIIYSV